MIVPRAQYRNVVVVLFSIIVALILIKKLRIYKEEVM